MPHIDRRTTSLDVRLRQAFSTAQALPSELRELAVMQFESNIENLAQWHEHRAGLVDTA